MKKENTDKLTDKAFLRLIITSFLAIILCLVCLCSTTWAWFADDVTSTKNPLKSGRCLLTITVADNGTVVKDANTETVTLQQGITYSVTLSLPKDSASGYCIIQTDTNKYYSEYLTTHTNEEPKVLSFFVTVQEEKEVSFKTRWGIHTEVYKVLEGETLSIE